MASLWALVCVSYKSRRLGQMIFQTLAALRVSDSVNPPGLPGLADPSPPPRSLPDTFSLEGHLFFFWIPTLRFHMQLGQPWIVSCSAPGM